MPDVDHELMSQLVTPSRAYETSYREAEVERGHDGSAAAFAALLVALARLGEGKIPGRVATTELWLVADDVYLGKVMIRHALDGDDDFRGHLGLTIRPSRRRQGLGTRLFALALPRAHALGIDPALVTCAADNVASRRLIARHHGLFVDEVAPGPDHPAMLRFHVATSPSARAPR